MTLTTYADLGQGSDEWLAARCGILTASVIGKLISKSSPDPLTVGCVKCLAMRDQPCVSLARKDRPPIKTLHDERLAAAADLPPVYTMADTDTAQTAIRTLAAERITGHVEYVHPTFDMQRGHDDEPYAREAYAAHKGVQVAEVGFMTLETESYKIGFSPDGLVGDDGLIEIKSRKPHSHLATILAGRPPAYNLAQMQTGMFVTDREWCDYVSFSAGLPLYVKRVYWDADWFKIIPEVATQFETNIASIVAEYKTATSGLPMTERHADLQEIF